MLVSVASAEVTVEPWRLSSDVAVAQATPCLYSKRQLQQDVIECEKCEVGRGEECHAAANADRRCGPDRSESQSGELTEPHDKRNWSTFIFFFPH
jgi:hypothetical protein